MKLFLVLLMFSLSGCAKTPTVTENLIADVSKMVEVLETTLPEGCKTVSYEKQVEVINSTINNIEKSYETELRQAIEWGEMQRDKFLSLAFAVIVALAIILSKKVRNWIK